MAVKHALGTAFSWNGTTVGKLTSIGGFSATNEVFDATTHDSASGWEEITMGLRRSGEFPIEGLFDPSDAGQAAMWSDFGSGTIRQCVVTFPGSVATWTFNAGITAVAPAGEATLSGDIPFRATVKISGVPTFAISASTGLTTPFFSISESAVITPAPSGSTYTYVATVLTDITSVTVTPTASSGTITVNGNTVVSGEASSAITLGAAGSVTTITIAVTETGKSTKTYTIYLSRAAS